MDLSNLQLPRLIDQLSGLSTTIILGVAIAHFFYFLVLSAWSKSDLRMIAGTLDDFTRGLQQRSVLSKRGHLSDQIEAFIAYVNDVLNDPSRVDERKECLVRMKILDEKRNLKDA